MTANDVRFSGSLSLRNQPLEQPAVPEFATSCHFHPQSDDPSTHPMPSKENSNMTLQSCGQLCDFEVFCCDLRKATLQLITRQDELIATYATKLHEHASAGFIPIRSTTGCAEVSKIDSGERDCLPTLRQTDSACSARRLWNPLTSFSKRARSIDIEEVLEDSSINQFHSGRRFIDLFVRALAWWDELEEPIRTGVCSRIVSSYAFNILCAAVILLHCIFTVDDANYASHHALEESHGDLSIDYHQIVLGCITVFYLLELILRLGAHRLYFFCNQQSLWNVLDLCLVLTAVPGFPFMNISYLRLFHILRISRGVRILRSVHFLNELDMMIHAMLGSLITFLLCSAVLALVLFAFSVYFVECIALYVTEHHEVEQAEDLLLRFGSVQRAMVSLMAAITGGEDWMAIYETLSKVGGYTPAIFVLFITFSVFAATNVVTAIFIEKAMKIAKPHPEILLMEKRQSELDEATELKELVQSLHIVEGDTLTFMDFLALVKHDRFADFLRLRGVDIKQRTIFFDMVSSSFDKDIMTVDALVSACLRLKGHATSLDLHTFTFQTKAAWSKQQRELSQLGSRLLTIEQQLLGMNSRALSKIGSVLYQV
eukprot:TRINITY_DN50532_c0_g1_i1.p1 TRINITY_DN50532_c0_g1~~TRINITY_DN50532_c0_g1_i1.p1  ORF type:complete len:599 (-),score=86.52 TRINITY_DN50532_c0_g1_i1:74-1870(-)